MNTNSGTIKSGQRVETSNFGWAEAITDQYEIEGKASRGGLVDVRFDNTGNVRKAVYGKSFQQGCIRDGSVIINIEVGQVWNTNNDGKVEVLVVTGPKDIDIVFLNSGNKYKCQKDALLTGFVKDKPAVDVRVAQKADDTMQRAAERLEQSLLNQEIRNKQRVAIEEGKAARARRAEALKLESHARWLKYQENEIKRVIHNQELIDSALSVVERYTDEYVSSKGVLDMDFKDRNGNWVLRYSDPSTGDFIQTRLGKIHNNFTQRANQEGSVQNVYGTSYAGVTASELFKDAQKFADWAVAQHGWNIGYQLEKDLLVDGNREYGENTCCFLPYSINAAIKSKLSGTIVKGGDLFSAFVNVNGSRLSLGRYESKDEAEEAAANFKRKRLYKLAEEYKGTIDPRAYDRLVNFQ
jgi:hypothetical protein